MEYNTINKKSRAALTGLSWFFLLSGFAYLTIALGSLAYELSALRNEESVLGLSAYTQNFSLLDSLARYFDLLSAAFFAWLGGSVIRILYRGSNSATSFSEACAILSSVFYAAKGLVGICLHLGAFRALFQFTDWIVPYTLVGLLEPFLYALALYIVYSRFTQLTRFTEEVA